MPQRVGWVSVTLVILIAIGAGGYAFARSDSSPAISASQSSADSRASREALSLWRRFGAQTKPRPLILTGQGRIEAPTSGFPSRADEAAFLTGRYRLRTRLPRGPAVSDRFRILSGAAGYRTIGHPIPGHRARPHGRLIIRAIRFGQAHFETDRGQRRLPAWKFYFVGVRDPAKLLAVTSSSIFTAPQPRKLLDDGSPYPDSPATILRDDRTISVSFIGASAGSAPCDASYSLAATTDRDAVALTVVEHPAPSPAKTVCGLVGYERSATIRLAQPLGPRALISSNYATVISLVRQNPKQLTVSVPGERPEYAQLGSYCLPSRDGVEACDAAFDRSPPGHLPVQPGGLVTFGAGAPATSLTVQMATTDLHGQVSYPGGALHGSHIEGNRWEVQLPKKLPSAHILVVSMRYAFGDASFEAGIDPAQDN